MITIIEAHGEEEALRLANDTEYGLSSAVHTADARSGRCARPEPGGTSGAGRRLGLMMTKISSFAAYVAMRDTLSRSCSRATVRWGGHAAGALCAP